MMTKQEKREKLDEITPYVWDMYKHLFDSRMKLQEKLNFFLAVNTLFIICYLQVFQTELENLSIYYIIPFLMLVIPTFLLFTNLIARSSGLPWFNEELIKKTLENEIFNLTWLATIFASAIWSFKYRKRIVGLLYICYIFVFISIVWISVLLLIELFSSSAATSEIAIITLFIITGFILCIGLLFINFRKFDYNKEEERINEYFREWIMDNDMKEKP